MQLFAKSEQRGEKKKTHKLVSPLVGAFSGFLQGAGLSGASVRTNFLYSENLKIEEVRGTSNILNFVIFATASIVRITENQLSLSAMLTWTAIFAPILFVSMYAGRKVLIRLSDKVKDSIIILTMLYVVVELFLKGIKLFM